MSPADATSLAIEAQRLAARVREETTGFALSMLSHLVSSLGMSVAIDDKVQSFSYRRAEEWIGTEEDGRRCWVESVALTLECGCVYWLEDAGGSITQGRSHQCATHRPALVLTFTAVEPADIPF
jgi:hypothetical protein